MILLNELRPIQSLVASLFLKHRRLMLSLPRQYGGKTELGVRLMKSLLQEADTRQGIFLAKDKKSAKRAVREKHLRLFPKEQFKVNTEVIISKENPSNACYIESVDKEPDRIRGGTYDYVHWSEVAFSKIEQGYTIRDVFDRVVQPTLEMSNGYCLLESTMNGLNGWTDLWDIAAEFDFKTFIMSFSAMVELGLISKERFERVKKRTHPDVFRQEYECERVTFAGKVYSEFNLNKHVTADIPWPEDWQTVVAGVDWGFNDATAIVFAYIKDGVIHVFDEIYLRQRRLEEVLDELDEHKGKLWPFGSFAAACDHDPQKLHELELRNIPCSNADKADVLGNRLQVKELMWKDKFLVHPRCVYTIKDLSTATWDSKKINDIDYSQCTWGHYDCEAAVRYLVRELSGSESEKEEENPFLKDEEFEEDRNELDAVNWEMARIRRAQHEYNARRA